MALFARTNDRRRIIGEFQFRDDEVVAAIAKQHGCSPKLNLDGDKKVRREIANSNERRRMQSINAGFQCLRNLIPHHEGEKLSKAAILQQTSEHVHNLEQEKTKLLAQNAHLKSMLMEMERARDETYNGSPPPKRKKRDTESSDEGISLGSSMDSNDEATDELQREMIELRRQLDQERWLRMMLEERTRVLETQLYPEHLRHLAAHVQAQIHKQDDSLVVKDTGTREVSLSDSEEKVGSDTNLRTSMSRKNLETIVEAIRHLEGDRILFDERKADEKHPVGTSEESERECSDHEQSDRECSDHEESKSDSSGRVSPVCYAQLHSLPSVCHKPYTDSYPIQSSLHQPIPPQYYRPGVIVHKS